MNDVWQVISRGETFDGDLDALKLVVSKGVLQPTDKVRCNEGEWVEAQEVAALQEIFRQVHDSTGQGTLPALPPKPPFPATLPTTKTAYGSDGFPQSLQEEFTPQLVAMVSGQTCQNHLELDATYVCFPCSGVYCSNCLNLVGIPSAGVCRQCGGLCLPFTEAKAKILRWVERKTPFGWVDLQPALTVTIHDWPSVLLGSVFYTISQMWSGYMIVFFPYFVIIGLFIGNIMMFVCASHIIKRVASQPEATGKIIELNIFLEDPFHAFSVGTGILLVSLGPLFAIVIAAIFYNLRFLAELSSFPQEWLTYWGMIFLIWAVFYYPIGMLVGGYTESFKAAVNPLLGFDTARRMGFTFVKLYGAYLLGGGMLACLTWLSFQIPVPGLGVLVGILIFWANLFFAGLIGRALFKTADQLHIKD
ncbi:MAG: zinc ribbon domain-containing protein [Blastocatellia bacterium]|nr:zinc ribbon domain-containing protein [Blastocatellia bacterium]